LSARNAAKNWGSDRRSPSEPQLGKVIIRIPQKLKLSAKGLNSVEPNVTHPAPLPRPFCIYVAAVRRDTGAILDEGTAAL
jgi:hypothetical protein